MAMVVLLLSSLFIGLGFILGQIYHFSLFEATLICLLTSLVLFAFLLASRFFLDGFQDDYDDDDFELELDDLDKH
ncbi:hypothetical protein [Candidatus Albibeggiatoa sp. nov. BB20]|uniref:hypothetical protein n=1 Tax=Candidatus Albibeggiatoa sp. nov. BB20 TaxID=3162723 RepID=UPI00336568B1